MNKVLIFVFSFMISNGYINAQDAVLHGRVTNTGGQEISGTTVTAGVASATSDTNGIYELKNLPEGKIVLQVQSIGYSSYTDTVFLLKGVNTKNIVLKNTREVDNVTVTGQRKET